VVLCSSQPPRSALGPTQPPIQRVPGPFSGSKASGADVNLSHPYRAQIKSECAIILIPLFALIACKGVSLLFTIPPERMCFTLSPSFRFFYQNSVRLRVSILSHVFHTLRPSHLFLIHHPNNVPRSVKIMYVAVPHYATCTCLCYSPTLQSKHSPQQPAPNTPHGVLSL